MLRGFLAGFQSLFPEPLIRFNLELKEFFLLDFVNGVVEEPLSCALVLLMDCTNSLECQAGKLCRLDGDERK